MRHQYIDCTRSHIPGQHHFYPHVREDLHYVGLTAATRGGLDNFLIHDIFLIVDRDNGKILAMTKMCINHVSA